MIYACFRRGPGPSNVYGRGETNRWGVGGAFWEDAQISRAGRTGLGLDRLRCLWFGSGASLGHRCPSNHGPIGLRARAPDPLVDPQSNFLRVSPPGVPNREQRPRHTTTQVSEERVRSWGRTHVDRGWTKFLDIFEIVDLWDPGIPRILRIPSISRIPMRSEISADAGIYEKLCDL